MRQQNVLDVWAEFSDQLDQDIETLLQQFPLLTDQQAADFEQNVKDEMDIYYALKVEDYLQNSRFVDPAVVYDDLFDESRKVLHRGRSDLRRLENI